MEENSLIETGRESNTLEMQRDLDKSELATTAMAQREIAMIQAAYSVAISRKRDENNALARMLSAAKRPRFAEKALYKKPVGKEYNKKTKKWDTVYAENHSIRCAEALQVYWGNMQVGITVLHDTASDKTKLVPGKRTCRIMVVDLETNALSFKDVVVIKTVERKNAKNRTVLSERLNSYDQKVALVIATDDEVILKTSIEVAKAKRDLILGLIPFDIKQEIEDQIRKTNEGIISKNIEELRKKIVLAFYEAGVSKESLETHLGQKIETLSPSQIDELRSIHQAISDGETTWKSVVEIQKEVDAENDKPPKEPAKAKARPADRQPKPGELKPGGDTLKKSMDDEMREAQDAIYLLEQKIGTINGDFDFSTIKADKGDLEAYGKELSEALAKLKKVKK